MKGETAPFVRRGDALLNPTRRHMKGLREPYERLREAIHRDGWEEFSGRTRPPMGGACAYFGTWQVLATLSGVQTLGMGTFELSRGTWAPPRGLSSLKPGIRSSAHMHSFW